MVWLLDRGLFICLSLRAGRFTIAASVGGVSPMKKLIPCFLITTILSGCLYSNTRFPLDEDLWKTELGTKVGVASNYSVLWLVAWGDAGVKKAAENGGLTTINHMDMGIESYVFGLYLRRDTIVYGD